MENFYTDESNILQLISLLKKHNIRNVIASPGNTNITFIGSIQNDSFFNIYSCVDERSACYMACGLAEESGEPVVISCTGATAARNYPSGLTEAFYRKLPVLAVTSSQFFGRTGQLFPQFTDRNSRFNDIVVKSYQVPYPYSDEEKWSNNVKINDALLELRRGDGGPIHINLETHFSSYFDKKNLPNERVIKRYINGDKLPEINHKKICIFIGSHKKFDDNLQDEIDIFCSKYNAIVLCDHTSNFKGKYRVLGGLVASQQDKNIACKNPDLIIHLGEISGSYYSFNDVPIWRVNQDGEIRDCFKQLINVFQMKENDFFKYYNSLKNEEDNSYLEEWRSEEEKLTHMLPELPLSNVWLAKVTANKLPQNSVLYLGILNSLRSWNLFDVPNSVYSYSNVGGFGIDGVLSSCIGASFYNPKKIYFCVLGDLSTFYDLNSLGNRHISSNLRIIVSNNGTGFEMHCEGSLGYEFGKEADKYMAAGGHFGSQSRKLLKHFAEDLGFEYIKAESKEEYLEKLDYFTSNKEMEKPILFEVFTSEKNDEYSYFTSRNLLHNTSANVKKMAKNVLGINGYTKLKRFIKK